MKLLEKIIFLLRRPKVIIVTNNGKELTRATICQVLEKYFKKDKDFLIFDSDLIDPLDFDKFKFLIKHSSLPVLVATHTGEIPQDKILFAGNTEKTIKIRELVISLPFRGFLVLNTDDETVKDLKINNSLTFGLSEKADIQASDIKVNGGTNFKIIYKGNIVPIWLGKIADKEQIYATLAAVSVGAIFGLNLVETSQALKNFRTSDIISNT